MQTQRQQVGQLCFPALDTGCTLHGKLSACLLNLSAKVGCCQNRPATSADLVPARKEKTDVTQTAESCFWKLQVMSVLVLSRLSLQLGVLACYHQPLA